MIETITSPLRAIWEGLLERLFFLPPFPETIDTLALFSLLLVVGLLLGEWLHAHVRWPKVIGYVLAGILFGPSALGWISIEALAQARPIADAALGLLMMEVGRRLDLSWLRRNPEWLAGGIAVLVAARPRAVWRAAQRSFFAWQVWRKFKEWRASSPVARSGWRF